MKTTTIVFAFTLLFAIDVLADSLPVKPGLWESTTTRANPLTGEQGTQVTRSCVEVDTFDPETLMRDAEECEVRDSTVKGSTMTFSMLCTAEQGVELTVDGTYQTEGESGSGHMEMKMMMGPMTISYKAEWDATWIGEC